MEEEIPIRSTLARRRCIAVARPLARLALALGLAWLGVAANALADEDAPPETERLENTLRWKTASEVDNFGFDIYRGDSEDGPFERLTDEPIPGAGTTDEPQEYAFSDDTIEAGKAYWYYVESISMMGVRERFTPIFRAKAKGSPPSDPERSRGDGASEDGSSSAGESDGDSPRSGCGAS